MTKREIKRIKLRDLRKKFPGRQAEEERGNAKVVGAFEVPEGVGESKEVVERVSSREARAAPPVPPLRVQERATEIVASLDVADKPRLVRPLVIPDRVRQQYRET